MSKNSYGTIMTQKISQNIIISVKNETHYLSIFYPKERPANAKFESKNHFNLNLGTSFEDVEPDDYLKYMNEIEEVLFTKEKMRFRLMRDKLNNAYHQFCLKKEYTTTKDPKKFMKFLKIQHDNKVSGNAKSKNLKK